MSDEEKKKPKTEEKSSEREVLKEMAKDRMIIEAKPAGPKPEIPQPKKEENKGE